MNLKSYLLQFSIDSQMPKIKVKSSLSKYFLLYIKQVKHLPQSQIPKKQSSQEKLTWKMSNVTSSVLLIARRQTADRNLSYVVKL